MHTSAARILLVDDEPALLKMAGAYLGRLGYAVTMAASPDGAWAEVEACADGFAVAVLDGTMPGLPVIDLAIRLLTACPCLHVLTASGYPVDITPLEAAAPGRVAFLQKPFTPEMLAVTIRRMLAAQEENI